MSSCITIPKSTPSIPDSVSETINPLYQNRYLQEGAEVAEEKPEPSITSPSSIKIGQQDTALRRHDGSTVSSIAISNRSKIPTACLSLLPLRPPVKIHSWLKKSAVEFPAQYQDRYLQEAAEIAQGNAEPCCTTDPANSSSRTIVRGSIRPILTFVSVNIHHRSTNRPARLAAEEATNIQPCSATSAPSCNNSFSRVRQLRRIEFFKRLFLSRSALNHCHGGGAGICSSRRKFSRAAR